MKDLTTKAYVSLIVAVAIMGAILFGTAGTLRFWQAWTFIGIYIVMSIVSISYLVRHDQALLARRMRGPSSEPEKAQRVIMPIMMAAFIAVLVVPGFDHRLGWSTMPVAIDIAGDLITIFSLWSMYVVVRTNSFASANVEVAAEHKVISTGVYAVVRHPMYAGGSLMFVGIPLALGSYWGLLACVLAFPTLIWRLLDEERLLRRDLPGYVDYCDKVRWRLIPNVF